jgi:hypothetical protein
VLPVLDTKTSAGVMKEMLKPVKQQKKTSRDAGKFFQ